jgi:gluconolactonase
MRTQVLSSALAALFGAALVTAQAPASGPSSLQAPADPRYKSVIDTCKTPPPAPAARGGGPAGAGRGAAAPAPAGPREYTVTAIPGVIAAGQKWTKVWETSGNNADGIVGTPDGGLLVAQNDNAQVLKLERDGKTSVAYKDTNTGGALSFSPKGTLFIVQRGIGTAVWQLAPERKMLANRINGDPLECLGGVINDITADSKGGAYFTMGGLFYVDPKGTVTRYGQDLRTNGVLLSRDEKTLFVTNGQSVAAFDVQPNGALTNQREFVRFPEGGGDGITIDSEGRIYVTGASGVQVAGPDGKYIGLIPTPQGVITAAFSGPDKKTLYAVVSIRKGDARDAEIISIPTLAQGYRGRAK